MSGRDGGEPDDGRAPDAPTPSADARPEQSKDDTDAGWGEVEDPDAARDDHERWLRDQRPPHWG